MSAFSRMYGVLAEGGAWDEAVADAPPVEELLRHVKDRLDLWLSGNKDDDHLGRALFGLTLAIELEDISWRPPHR